MAIGIHALKYVELSEGGRGKKGGLSEYARQIGKSQDSISQYQKASLVYTKLPTQVGGLWEKTKHLYHISKTPEAYWQQLTKLLIKHDWTVKQTEEICKSIRDIEIPKYLKKILPPDKYIQKTINEVLAGEPPRTPRDVENWVKAITKVGLLRNLFDNPYFPEVNL